jgi:Phytanoyl-CoA dioxygenase (PhyH)
MLSAKQRRELESRGVVCLPGAADPLRVAALRERVLEFVKEKGLEPEGAERWRAIQASKLAPVARELGFAELWGPRVVEAIDDVLGPGRWDMPRHAGQILPLTWPQPDQPWLVPEKQCHLDYPAPGAAQRLPGLQLFLCLDRVEPRAGATLVAAGVARRVEAIRASRGPTWRGRSAQVRSAALREVPWFRALASLRPGEDRVARFMNEATDFEGSSLQVVELTGEPGDVWLMHPWMLHAASANCGTRPRMVITERLRTK